MPNLPAVFVELKATTNQFQASFADAKKTVNDFSAQSTSGMQKLEQVGKVAFLGLAGAATAFGGIAVKAALEGEAAHAQLVQAVQNSGEAFSSVSGQVEDMSGRFAKLGYENDQVEAALARLTQSTGNVSGAMQNMGLVADFARARHLDLEQAATLVGKVMNGNVAALQRVGISTKDAAGNTLTAAQALQMLSERFGGAAQAQANTYAGKLQAMNAEWHNMVEAVGNALLPTLANLASATASVVGWFDHHREVALAIAGVFAGPLTAAMGVYIAKQAMAFGSSVVTSVETLTKALFGIVPAVEAAEGAEAGLATTTALATGGLSVLGAGLGLVAAHFLGHASATHEAAAAATAATGAVSGLGDAEGDLGGETDGATNSLKRQSDLLKQLTGDTDAQQSEILKLIGDQNSLDAATAKLKESTGANSEVTKQAAQHTKDLAEANKAAEDATAKVTDALDKQAKAKKKLDDLMKPQTIKNIVEAQDDFQAAQDAVGKTSRDLTDKQKALNDAIEKYGPNSKEAQSAQWDYNAALRDAHQATNDLDTASQALANTYRPTIGTVDDIAGATKDYNDATKDVTTAQGNQKDAQNKLNDVLKNRDAIAAAKTDTKNLADNTLAWQQATATLNGDWKTLQGLIAQHPELRDQLVSQITALKNNLPKGADTSALNGLLDKLNAWGKTLQATAPPGSMLAAITQGQPLFGNVAVAPAPPPSKHPADGWSSDITFAGGAAEGAVVKARPGGRLMLVGEGGKDEAIVPLDQAGNIGGGATIGDVTIHINGAGDPQAVARAVRDEVLRLIRRNVNGGLG